MAMEKRSSQKLGADVGFERGRGGNSYSDVPGAVPACSQHLCMRGAQLPESLTNDYD